MAAALPPGPPPIITISVFIHSARYKQLPPRLLLFGLFANIKSFSTKLVEKQCGLSLRSSAWSHSHPRFTGLYTLTSGVSLQRLKQPNSPGSEVSASATKLSSWARKETGSTTNTRRRRSPWLRLRIGLYHIYFVSRSIRLYVFADSLSILFRLIGASLLRIFLDYRDVCRLRSNSATSSTFTFSPP